MKKPEAATLDPPEVLVTRGGDEGQVPVETAVGGTNQVTIWEMISGWGALMTDLCDFLGRLDEDPRLPEVPVLMNLLMARMR